jgi:hypothetical protein
MIWFQTCIQDASGKCLFDQYCSQTFASQTIIIDMLFKKKINIIVVFLTKI